MKRILSLTLALALLFAGAKTCLTKSQIADKAMRRAAELYLPVACQTAEGIQPEGTAFPVGEHLVMTAAHLDCQDSVTVISLDSGKTWHAVPAENLFRYQDQQNNPMVMKDVQLMVTPDISFKHPAEFRSARPGEAVAGKGIINMEGTMDGTLPIYDGTYTKGFITRVLELRVFSTNSIGGGLSGSALVAEDGKVVGMVVQSWPAYTGGNNPTTWFTAAVPAPVLEDLLRSFLQAQLDKTPPPTRS